MTQVADSPLKLSQARASIAPEAERAAPGRGAQLVCGMDPIIWKIGHVPKDTATCHFGCISGDAFPLHLKL